ncbi:DNA helicase [Flavipsychrobacter stenotrophus]|uniref:DNA helicase n=1 Tax=Flavipsychrobacter stenotrophus TaxID=2077091 RepID=A0A2S7SY11_9BACT|nr:AAA domain-containing protein [Flavipsychrobacter stenotrophus]PQJ11823.1 DNA helicase [Flavipsychrobacter stenotrophus]
MTPTTTFQQYVQSAFTEELWSTDDVVQFVLPLFEEVLSFHENNQVGSFGNSDTVFLTNGRLDIDENYTHAPVTNVPALQDLLNTGQIGGFSISGRLRLDEDLTQGESSVTSLQIQRNPNDPITQPAYLPGYQCYEIKAGHHDAQTDIFCLGLVLGSVVMGLDLYALEDLEQFVAYRDQPAGINGRIHPTISALVTEMTELDRRNRPRDLQEIVERLKYYRDYDPQRQTDLAKLAALQVKKPSDRRGFILSKLRNRLFDTTRRNRLLYYKPNSKFVNLTVSSVPMVLHYQSINPTSLFIWNSELSTQIIQQKDISLNKYLRFEDHLYLTSQLNSIRHTSENDKKEYGFSQLKLAVAFLHWHNLKESPQERVLSPLLLLPVELDRKKSIKEERFTLKITDNTAIVNPVLSNYLKDLYGLNLPESIDFDDVSMTDFFALVQDQIATSKQGIKLNYIDKPRIKVVHTIARQTINTYRKKLKLKGSTAFHHIDYNYSDENYKPFGLELFKQKIQLKQTALEILLSEHTPTVPFGNFAAVNEQAKSTFHLTDGENNPYSWDFDVCNIVLGNFNYKKMSLVSDYNKIQEEQTEHNVFTQLFSNEPRPPQNEDVANDPAEWHHVITADPTQAKAVMQSRTGKSYIIQGPPGTGKSQTITNLIADFLTNGKTVLFVCEKRAALDVVYHRLQQNQLSELCCYIHDSQGDKKEFIRDLRTIYDDYLKNKLDLSAISAQRKLVTEQLVAKIEVLKLYHGQQAAVSAQTGVSTRLLIDKLVELKKDIPLFEIMEQEATPVYNNWLQFGTTISELGKALKEIGKDPKLANHPFKNLGNAVLKAENPFTLMDSLAKHSLGSIEHIVTLISHYNIPPQFADQLQKIKSLVGDSAILESLAQSNNLKLVQRSNPEAKEFDEVYRHYKQLQDAYRQALETNKRWTNKFDKQDVQLALEVAQKYEQSFFRFLNGNWRRLKKQMGASYDFSAHQLKPAFSIVLRQLQDEYKALDNANQTKAETGRKYNVENIDVVYSGVELLRNKQGDKEIDYLLQHTQSNELVLQLSKLNNILHQLELALKDCMFDFNNKSVNQIKEELTDITRNAGALKDLLPSMRKFADLPENVQQFIRKLPLTPLQAEAAMASKTLDLIFEGNASFAAINHKILQDTASGIEHNYKELLKVNSNFIRAKRRQCFLQNYELSNTALSGLTPDQKKRKKEYTEGRRILEHEMSKTMRYKSIRELASNESGKVLKDIKPVWLMSPLSVSDSLPLDTTFFDVVIFDEASQITLEEGIPALFRAPQTIIVGDEKQMPPSNFFNAKAEDPEDLEIIDGESEDEILSADADSLLVQGSRKLSSTMLRWHYRSRYETLISYSNHAFYEAGLLTIPDKTIHQFSKPLLEINNTEEGITNAKALLNESISFHYLTNSIYEARSNVGEAGYIANMIKALLLGDVQETIGVVAFSQEQQGIIEEAIASMALADKAFEEALEKAYNRKDDGQFTGLFVKNLENVQGDERDIIIMSVCYGHDSNKKMLMNFGPINRKGGEKRLNVIFSRAKKHMAIVSSIRHNDITNDHNDGANYFKRFLHYAEMVSTGNMTIARTILDSLMAGLQQTKTATDVSSATTQQIKQALEAKGYVVNEKIGQSNFKCTLGVKKNAADTNYSLGILVDDEQHYMNSDLVEQYYQRPAILQSFGWEIMNVYAKDWLEDRDRVINSLVKFLD